MTKEITFSDILIEPQYSEVESRSLVDTSVNLGNVRIDVPVISANMRNITGSKMALEMYSCGGLGILHRFNSTKEAVDEFNLTQRRAGVSIGVKNPDCERFNWLYGVGARLFCIDVAHGHHLLVKRMLEWINHRLTPEERKGVTIIAGNVATYDGAKALAEWGADVVKVGIGSGSICQTRRNTGVGVPQFHALREVNRARREIEFSIISDGGIVHLGDIAKSLIFADAVMVGSLLAGTSETPGKVFRDNNDQFYKVYGGSASGENKEVSGQTVQFVEGVMKSVPFRGHVRHIVREIKESLQSAFSYVGAKNLAEFQQKVRWNLIEAGATRESKIS